MTLARGEAHRSRFACALGYTAGFPQLGGRVLTFALDAVCMNMQNARDFMHEHSCSTG